MSNRASYLPQVGRIHIGTSGYAYDHWRGLLYPPGLQKSRWLGCYAGLFSSVELNATFYKLPTVHAVEHWREQVPEDFVFACKGSRYLTHLKRLKDPGPGIEKYFERARYLGDKLGPILWQLPPQMAGQDLGRLEAFLQRLPRDIRHAFEFRSAAWYTDETADLLDGYGAAFCEHDLVDRKPPRTTGGFRYLRFHGAGAKYRGRYGRKALRQVAGSLSEASGDSFAFFNNDLEGHALYDALDLLDLLGAPQPDPLESTCGANPSHPALYPTGPRASPTAPRDTR